MSTKSTKKPAKVAKAPVKKLVKGVSVEGRKRPEAKLVQFSISATIPVQEFGNMTPTITVMAETYEEAINYAMPKIEAFYRHVAPNLPRFMRDTVTSVEKQVEVPAPKAPEAPAAPVAPAETTPTAPVAPAPEEDRSQVSPEAFEKAKKAIEIATSHDALDVIMEKIDASTKIAQADKPKLRELYLKKYHEIEAF